MSISDELREYVGNFYLFRYKDVREKLEGIADHIDAEHERAMADAELAAAPTEAQLEEWGYVKLPKDADGVHERVTHKLAPLRKTESGSVYCSCCGRQLKREYTYSPSWRFCPKCGAEVLR